MNNAFKRIFKTVIVFGFVDKPHKFLLHFLIFQLMRFYKQVFNKARFAKISFSDIFNKQCDSTTSKLLINISDVLV